MSIQPTLGLPHELFQQPRAASLAAHGRHTKYGRGLKNVTQALCVAHSPGLNLLPGLEDATGAVASVMAPDPSPDEQVPFPTSSIENALALAEPGCNC